LKKVVFTATKWLEKGIKLGGEEELGATKKFEFAVGV